MVKRKTILAIIASAALSIAGFAVADDAYDLISNEEFERSLSAPEDDEEFFDRAIDPLAPSIVIVNPEESKNQHKAPIDIEIEFVPSNDANIDFDSLEISYGSLGINVTKRVLEHAHVTPQGILSRGANLPRGKHKLTIAIRDDKGRTGKKRIKFEIVE